MFTVSRNERRKEFLFRAKNATGAQKFMYLTPHFIKSFFPRIASYIPSSLMLLGNLTDHMAYCSVEISVPIIAHCLELTKYLEKKILPTVCRTAHEYGTHRYHLLLNPNLKILWDLS